MATAHRRDSRSGGGGPGRRSRDDLWRRIVLVPPLDPALFDEIADKAAKAVAEDNRAGKNKSTQLRRFYDELLRWDQKVNGGGRQGARERLREHLPFIRMMNAKAAYAKGRDLVGQPFVDMLRHCLGQVDEDPVALCNCRHFFEAFMGFYKRYRQD